MIRVIEHGRFRKQKCPMCKCTFLFENEDMKPCMQVKIRHDEYVPLKTEEYFVRCPDCDNMILLKD